MLDVQPDFYDAGDAFVFGGWFTFGPGLNDGQRWYTVQGTIDTYFVSDSAVLPVYRTDGGRFDSAQATTTTEVGSLTVHFDDCRHGRLDYALIDGAPLQGSIPITRLLQSVSCQLDGNILSDDRNYHFSGTWADPGNSGQGLVLDVDPSQHALFGAWYTFARDAIAQRWYTLQATLTPDATASDNVAIYASSGGVFDHRSPTTTQQVGTASLLLDGCNAATLTYHFTTGDNAGADGVLELARIGDPPPRCVP